MILTFSNYIGFGQQNNEIIKHSYFNNIYGLSLEARQLIPHIYTCIFQNQLRDTANTYHTRYYYARKQGKFGMINADNEVIIPFLYDSLAHGNQTYIQFQLNNKWGLIDRDNNIVLPAGYQSLTLKNNATIIFEQNNLYGLMDLDFTTTVIPRFSHLKEVESSLWEEGSAVVYSDHLFEATDKGVKGIYDLNKDLFIPNVKNAYLSIQYHYEFDPSSEANYRFQHSDGNGETIYNSNGELVFQQNEPVPQVEFYNYRPVVEDCSIQEFIATTVSHDYLIVTNSDHSKTVYNLRTKQQSQKYKEVTFLFDKVVAIDKNGWSILDDSFKKIFRSKNNLPIVSTYSGLTIHYDNVNVDQFYEETGAENKSNKLVQKEPFIFLYRKIKAVKKEAEDEPQYHTCKLGLLNYETGQKIPPNYNQINWKTHHNALVFYAFKHVYDKDKRAAIAVQLDVYNSNYKKIKSIEIYDEGGVRTMDWWIDVHFFQDKNGKFGGLNPNGEVIFNFEYDNVRPLQRNYKYATHSELAYFILGKGSKKGLFDLEGNELFPIIYDNFRTTFDSSLIAHHGYYHDWYNKNLELVADSCTSYDVNTKQIIRKGFMFQINNNKLIQIDSSTVSFDGEKVKLVGKYIINTDGKMLFQSNYPIKIDEKGYYVIQKTGCHQRINLD